MSSQVPEVEVDESAVRFSDGLVISLSDIKEVKAPKVVLGAPNHPLTIAIASYLEQG